MTALVTLSKIHFFYFLRAAHHESNESSHGRPRITTSPFLSSITRHHPLDRQKISVVEQSFLIHPYDFARFPALNTFKIHTEPSCIPGPFSLASPGASSASKIQRLFPE
jgi:hypothetical protein